jgi:hypothetical protein
MTTQKALGKKPFEVFGVVPSGFYRRVILEAADELDRYSHEEWTRKLAKKLRISAGEKP